VFKDAKGNFDGRVFIGVMMGLGTISGGALKLWWSLGDTLPPFWLWAVPIAFLSIGLSAWVQRRREQRGIRERLERSARADALRSRPARPASDQDAINSVD
jgi:hypothetical protein